MEERYDAEYKYSLGNEELDELIGRVDSGSVLLIEGYPGSGKTILALSIVYRNVAEGRARATYVTLGESPEKLIEMAEKLGMSIGPYVSQGLVRFVKVPVIRDVDVVSFVSKLASGSIYGSHGIVVIDSVTPIIKLLSDYAARRSWLQNVLYDFNTQSWGLTILIADILSENDPDTRLLEYIADVVLELRYRFLRLGAIERSLRVKKLRGKGLKIHEYPFEIYKEGIRILNYISEEKRRRLIPTKKPIKIECPAMWSVLGEEIEPGTQIVMINRLERGKQTLFLRYWFHRVLELAKNGYKVGIIGYDLYTLKELSSAIRSIDVNIEQRVKILQIDPFTAAPSIVLSEELSLVEEENIDLLIITDIEKIVEAYGTSILRKYALYALQNLRRMGVVTVRYYTSRDLDSMARLYIDWSDIALEIVNDAKPMLKLLRSRLLASPSTVYEEEVRQCIERELGGAESCLS